MSSDFAVNQCSPTLTPGRIIQGKWHGRAYRIVRQIGSGANGVVHLAYRGEEQVAIKVGTDATALAVEYDRLQMLQDSSQGRILAPALFELDDLIVGNELRPVLVMEFVDGRAVDEFIKLHGREWVPLVILRILNLLIILHERGFAFCDLKPSNILLDERTAQPRLVDFGGVTKISNAVKEFTELYDRAWWGRGSRKADIRYDLFACAMLGLELLAPLTKSELDRLTLRRPQERSAWLDEKMSRLGLDDELVSLFVDIIKHTELDISGFRQVLLRYIGRHEGMSDAQPQPSVHTVRTRVRRRFDMIDWMLLISVLGFAATLVVVLWTNAI